MFHFLNRITTLPLWAHVGAASMTFIGFGWINRRLDASYAASNHPVDYAAGQTTFSGDSIKGFYAEMIQAGTLDIYRTTQIIDFGFILAMLALVLRVSLALISRISRRPSLG